MLALQIISAEKLIYNEINNKQFYYLTIEFNLNEIYKTNYSNENINPIWHEIKEINLNDLRSKEKDYNRPLFLEYLYIYIYLYNEKNNSNEKIAETRVLLANIGPPQFYRLIKPDINNNIHNMNNLESSKQVGQLLFAITLTEDDYGEGRIVGYQSLHEEMSTKMIKYAPLFLNFDLSPLSLIGADPLPGPLVGEMILDRYESVEVNNIVIQ